jgi:hypothetical protein
VSLLSIVLLLNRSAWFERVILFLKNDRLLLITLGILFLLLIEIIQDLIFVRSPINPPYYQTYLDLITMLRPLLFGAGLLIIQLLVVIMWIRSDILQYLWEKKSQYLGLILPWLFLILLMGFIQFLDLGFISRPTRPEILSRYGKFLPTRAPLPGTQVLMVLFVLLVLFLLYRILKDCGIFNLDHRIIAAGRLVAIWLIAFFLWKAVPLESNIMIDATQEPARTVFPSSDAFYYDKEALRFLLGEGFSEDSTHMMYSAFLAGVHSLVGLEYLPVMTVQLAVYALIPVGLYLVTTELSSSFAGILAAILLIFRERNAMLLGGDITGVGFNQLMSENLALLTFLFSFFAVVLWLKDPNQKSLLPWIGGALMGVTVLIRVELLAVYIAFGLGSLIFLRSRKAAWLRGMTAFTLAMVLIVGPWMVRNWQKAGQLGIDKSDFVQRLVSGYFEKNHEPQDKFSERADNNFRTGVYAERDHHGTAAKYIPDRLSSSLIQSVLFLPTGHQPLLTIGSMIEVNPDQIIAISKDGIFSEFYLVRYVRNLPYFWYDWDGTLMLRSVVPLVGVLFLCTLGMWSIWKQYQHMITILILAFTAHLMIWAVAGYSGGRFIKLVDWFPLVFYSIGLTVLLSILWRLIIKREAGADLNLGFDEGLFSSQKVPFQRNHWLERGVLVLVLLIGTAPTILEPLIPQQYTEEKKAQVVESIHGDIKLHKGQYVYLYGKMLYPRFYEANEKPLDDRKGTIPDPTRDRMDLYLIGTRTIWVSFPTKQPVESFRHDVDVIVEGRIVRDTNFDLMYGGKQPYFLASRVLIIK